MRNLEKSLVSIYHAERGWDDEMGMEYFNAPQIVKGSISTLTSNWDFVTQGFAKQDTKRFNISKQNTYYLENNTLTTFSRGDKLWVSTEPLSYVNKSSGENADYMIEGISETLTSISLTLKRIT